MVIRETDPRSKLSLPPGFRFYPTDEELLVQYLCRKVAGHDFSLQIIGDVDLYKFDAWDLPGKALFGEKEWYFFSPRDRKYPNGSRPNRMAGSGYWKATGTDKIITAEGRKVGIKKALVFYVGKAPKGTKTNWIMHEYRLYEPPRKNGSTRLDDWVLCRIYKKNSGGQKPAGAAISGGQSKEYRLYSQGSPSSPSSQYGDVLDSTPEVNDHLFFLPRLNSLKNFNHNHNEVGPGSYDWATLVGLSPLCPDQHGQAQAHQQIDMTAGMRNDVYTPIPVGEDEVQSGLGAHRGNNSGYFSQNMSAFTQGFPNSLDPFGVRHPDQHSGLGFRQ